MAICGILNLRKPAGWTSRDVVNRVERLAGPARAGHAGTLDPLATGVLVVCIGQATRLIQYVQRMPKHYRATFRLGCRSETDDTEGEVTSLHNAPRPTRDQLEAALPQFVGPIQQRPPAHSAVKVGGRRAYDLARAGRPVELPARTVTVHRLAVARYDFPELELDIQCGSGTYVRSLGRDLAESLGTAAVMTALERSAVGRFHVADAVPIDELNDETFAARLQPMLAAVADLPRVDLTDDQLTEIRHGRPIAMPSVDSPLAEAISPGELASASGIPDESASAGETASAVGPPKTAPTEYAAVDPMGNLAAILLEKRPGQLWPVRNFAD